jgi:hypothetical protein
MRSSTDRVCLLNIETVYGTATALAAAQAILLMEAEIQPVADKLERNVDLPYFGGDPFVLVGKRITLTAKCDLLGHATPGTAAPLGKLYRACAHAETLVPVGPPISVVYNPISNGFESACLDFYWAGIRFRMLGARGSLDMDFSIKQYAQGTVNLTGILVIPEDGEAPTPISWTAFQTPAAIETETWQVTVNSVNVCAQSLSLQQNATVNLIECSEGREVNITDRKPSGTLRVYKDELLSVWNPWSIADAQQIIVLQNSITKGAGLNVAVDMRVQLEYPKPTDIDGIAGFEIPFTCIPNAGDDEYTIVVS